MMIRWAFLDVGNLLFNDDPQTFFIHRRYFEAAAARAPGFTFDQFLAAREREVRGGNRWPTQSVLLQFLSAEELDTLGRSVTEELRGVYDEFNFPMPSVRPMLDSLRHRFRLGIIANQIRECRASLARNQLLDYFDIVAISEELGLHKPDEAIFRWALERGACDPHETVMIGDRHDNDVVPATALGMHTIWVRWPSLAGKGWTPSGQDAHAFVASHDREPFYGRVTRPDVAPSAVVTDLPGVLDAIDMINSQATRRCASD